MAVRSPAAEAAASGAAAMVPGTGILQHLHDGLSITVGDAAWLMSTISDNTATNLLLDRIIIRRVWDKMEALGLMNTKVHSKSFRRNSSVAMALSPDALSPEVKLLAPTSALKFTVEVAVESVAPAG